MERWLTILASTFVLVQTTWAQQPLIIKWLSSDNSQPIKVKGTFTDSRFPSISADGGIVVFQVGSGTEAQIWEARQGQATSVKAPPIANQPLSGIHPVITTDGNHIAFASWKDYSQSPPTDLSRAQIHVFDRLQNRIVPVSFLWRDTDGNGLRDTFEPSGGNCVPVTISADGRIVVFLAQSPNALNIVDEDGDGVADTVSNPPSGWLVLVHDRDADGNGVYDEVGIGATRTFVGSLDSNGNLVPAASVSVSANGRVIAFATPADPANPDENWRVVVRDLQRPNNTAVVADIPGAFAPALSDDGIYVAYLTPVQIDNDGDGQLNEDPFDGSDNDGDNLVDEDPAEAYWQTHMDLIVRQLVDPSTRQPPAQPRELRLSGLQLPTQIGTADGAAGWGYSDWWGAVTLATDPTDPNVVYVTFHAWATDLIDLQLVRNDLIVDPNNSTDRLQFYQGVPNIYLARFDFTNYDADPQAPNRVRLWRLNEWTDQQQPNKQRCLPISLSLEQQQQQYRLTLAPSLLPSVSFVNNSNNQLKLFIAFQSLAAFDTNDQNGLWDIYLAEVTLP